LLAILRHFAAYTNQKHSSLTHLLKLLKLYKPEANYGSLPRTGKGLLKIDGRDWPSGKNNDKNFVKPTELEDGGKYIHFGLGSALNCNSPGVLHKDANLLQFVRIYRENPSLLPITVRENVTVYKILKVMS
jgi:hypothetical protein